MSETQSPPPDVTVEEWLPLSRAAALLGVHSITLRRWSDSGRFPYYRTPGGHRRYALADIRRHVGGPGWRQALPVASGSAWADTALVQTRRQVAMHQQSRWLQAIGDEALRTEYRQMGQQMMGLVLQFVAAELPDATLLVEARRLGLQHAEYGLRVGLSLRDTLEATLFFRDILVESSLQVAPSVAFRPDANLRLLRRVNQLLNSVQLAIAEGYEQALAQEKR